MEHQQQYSKEAMQKFWETKVLPVIISLDEESCPFPKVREAFRENARLIQERYHCDPEIYWFDEFFSKVINGKISPMACWIDENQPIIEVSIPANMLSFEDKRKTAGFKNFQEVFDVDLLIGFMHELDHIALGLVGESESLLDMINGESIVWARTCENTIRLFVEEHHAKLTRFCHQRYDAWVMHGRNSENLEWRYFIATLHSDFRYLFES